MNDVVPGSDEGARSARLARIEEVLRAIVREARAEKLTFMAGSIAYHAFVSLLPLLVLLIAVFSSFGISLEAGIASLTRAMLTEEAGTALVEQITSSEQSAGLSALGGLVLLWGTLRIFRGLDTAFSDIYESEAENTALDQFADGLVVLGTFAVAIVAASYVGGRLPVYGAGLPAVALRQAILVVGLAVTFFPMYYVFPDTDVSVVEVLPGVLVAAVGLTTFATLFQYYVEFSSQGSSSNVVANVVLLLTWLYFSGLVILLGVAVNAVLSNRSRDVSIDPVFGGVPRGHDRPLADRETLVRELDRLARLLDDDPESVTVVVDGEEVALHPPQSLTVDESPEFGFGDDAVSVELRWTPREMRTERSE
ncbi:YihY/virulence factor BrkB family protein [Halomarina litorea]|uniref:YihY/virulence factor BrkB family protein n=1 Tax=Halomarina litorea TaxID=2961595 RepID=UPI0020C3D364|nr:YihY/virulence factor BrkB family protein [Halomarina sp. BCD28]